ncbi:bile acid beta-glucosidase [Legionella lansingensis]|uniref:Bile acid beta-glucosidase n=1 Tax=Legionella lansingensis TaxID=45067 RepID=A0A0W0VUG4_9GAMM|nr:hypothetical protein [Legionella lansingensis]KTD23621.1 bile acid beta-glucosidase [Legionella lansingensis]SNV52436.1 bile acid beta-glucosidase [Legionella lansingensis]
MKFKQIVDRYNRYWNEVVVPAYKQIKQLGGTKNHPFFASNSNVSPELMSQYCDGVLNILHNISRQLEAGLFEDPENARAYVAITREAAIKDLKKFKSYRLDPEVNKIIDRMLNILNPEVLEVRPPSEDVLMEPVDVNHEDRAVYEYEKVDDDFVFSVNQQGWENSVNMGHELDFDAEEILSTTTFSHRNEDEDFDFEEEMKRWVVS